MEPKLTKNEKKAQRQEEWREKLEHEQKKKLYQTIGLWGFGGLLLVLAIWALVAFSTGQITSTTSSITMPPVTAKDFQTQTSSSSAKATLTEYADFQCPACKAYYPIVKQLQTDFGDKLNVVYRLFPLKTVHQNALNSARAGYAASLQSKFWQMHDKLFETQESWATLPDPEATFVGYAKDLGMNTDQFKKDYEAQTTIDFVNKAYDDASAIGLNSTPTFFINGKQMTNPQSYQDFKAQIQSAMK